MRSTMTDRRKAKDEDLKSAFINDPDMKESKMNLRTYIMRRVSIKRLVIVVAVVIILFKLAEVYTSRDETSLYSEKGPNEEPLKFKPAERRDWIYSTNPQGTTETELAEMLDKISRHQDLGSPDMDSKQEKFKALNLKKKPYESTGSLKFKDGKFTLGGKPFKIISGAMHYFRVVPEYWDDRMKKMKACGLNTLETYVSWNLHEPSPNKFNFEGILNIKEYIELAKKNGLHVLLRPGPYICSEWDLGGLPAWLLKDPNMRMRSNYKGYLEAVDRFFGKLIPMVKDLQYGSGGPIIGVQVENEFGSYSSEVEHLLYLKNTLIKFGITEMFFTSEGLMNSISGFHNAPFYDEALPTVNFKSFFSRGTHLFDLVKSMSKDFPLVVMEFWSGWFDHWEKHHAFGGAKDFAIDVQEIFKAGASINVYMFHGGTNFGFTSGANWFNNTGYKTDVTSYDYIAPLSEAGDITPKYELMRALVMEYILKPDSITQLPAIPPIQPKAGYGEVAINSYMTLEDIITPIKPVEAKAPVPMEALVYNNNVGQNFGFILYRTLIHHGTTLSFTRPVYDRVQVLLNGIEVCLFTWHSRYWRCRLPTDKLTNENMLDILVEQQGRVNYVHKGFNKLNEERKGIPGQVMLDDVPVANWMIYPMEFNQSYLQTIIESRQWKPFANSKNKLGLYEGTLTINTTPLDTFINLKGWEKGVVFVNGINIGRYWKTGPQKTLYIPAPWLKKGKNRIVVFELQKAYHIVSFQKVHEIGDDSPDTVI